MQISTETTNTFLGKYYFYLAISVVVGVFAIGGVFLLWPQYQSLQTSGVLEYKSAVTTLESRQQYLQNLKLMEANYRELDKHLLRSMNNVLPEHQDSVLLFEEIETLLTEADLRVESMNIAASASAQATTADVPQAADDTQLLESENLDAETNTSSEQPKLANNIERITVTVNVTNENNSYVNFKEFLVSLEQYNHLIELESMSFSPDTSGTTLVFTTYQQTQDSNE